MSGGEPQLAANELLMKFRAQLFQWRETNPMAHVYALLDPNHPVSLSDPLSLGRMNTRPVSRHLEPVPRPDFSTEPRLFPQLLQLYVAGENGYVDESLLELTLECARARCRSVNGAYVAGWICSDAAPKALANHLANSGVVFDVSQGRQRFLPLFEPHRIALLASDPESRSFMTRWLGPMKHWMFVDAAQALKSVSPAIEQFDRPQAKSTLGQAQLLALSRVEMARFVILAMDNASIKIATQPERHIDAAMVRAIGAGLSHTEDILFYVLNMFALGAAWAEHPVAASLIRRLAGDPDARLAKAFAELPDGVLDEITSDARGRT